MGTFNDISANFELDAQGSLKIVEDADAIKQSIKNILFTLKGFRPGTAQEIYGTNTKRYTFALLNDYTANLLGEEILDALTRYEPRITIDNIDVVIDYDEQQLDTTVYYRKLKLLEL
jgi:phage baseplate assembly protein W